MKSIFAILAMFIGLACFAEVFEPVKYNELMKTYNASKKREDLNAAKKYLRETEFNKEIPDGLQINKLAAMVSDVFKQTKTTPNRAGILAQMDKLYKFEDEKAREQCLCRVMLGLKMYKEVEAELPKIKEICDIGLLSWMTSSVANNYLSKQNYDKAIELAKSVKLNSGTANTLQNAYIAKGMYNESFEVGKNLFLDTYITSPNTAMTVITRMMNRVPDNYDDAKLADLLAKIGKKYPAPGADFEAWKGFMGFIGYRYKALTGKDLFANSNK